MEFNIDSAIISTIISTIISIGIFGLREKHFEPQRWKTNIQFMQLEKKLESYGKLITLLQSLLEKGKRMQTGEIKENIGSVNITSNKWPHLLEVP
jgi:hypothetical protein